MPFNRDKKLKLVDLLARVRARIAAQNREGAMISFEIHVQKNLIRDLIQHEGFRPELDELELLAGDFDFIYPYVAARLHDAASRNLSEVHLDTYQDAHVVSVAFCAELNEHFECSKEDGLFDLIPIRSSARDIILTSTAEKP